MMTIAPHAPRFKSREEILAAGLTPYHAGQALDELNKWQMEHPAPPTPPTPLVVTQEQKTQLANLSKSLTDAKDRLLELIADGKTFTDTLEKTRVENVRPDAAREDALNAIVADWRIKQMRGFVVNIPMRRQEIEREIIGHFAHLNHTLEKINGEEFFLSGNRPELSCAGAIAAIEKILHPK